MRSEQKQSGFTLIELMIVVALIGVMSAVAIPGFQQYQMKSKRAEAYTNLNALSKSQKAYFAEWNVFAGSLPEPWWTTGVAPSSKKRNSAPVATSFATVGWAPEGSVFYDYDTCAPEQDPAMTCDCRCVTCFTSTAWGDLDNDSFRSLLMYVYPDADGATCDASFFGITPPVGIEGSVAWRVGSDDF